MINNEEVENLAKVVRNLAERKFGKPNLFRGPKYFYSARNQCLMYCDSTAEMHGLTKLEFDESVTSYVTQPKSFQYEIDGKRRRYTPDALVKFSSKRGGYVHHYQEFKTSQKAEEVAFQKKADVLKAKFQDIHNVGFEVIEYDSVFSNDDHLRRNCLYRFLRRNDLEEFDQSIGQQILKTQSQASISDFVSVYEEHGYRPFDAWTFIALNFNNLTFLGSPILTSETIVTWSI